jgi:hypothetical protein
MALCHGCQEFRMRMFQSINEFPKEGVDIHLHKSFAELSECADSCCHLCHYFRREICFDHNLRDKDFAQNQDHVIGVSVCKYTLWEKVKTDWQLSYGEGRTRRKPSSGARRDNPHMYRAQVTSLEQLVEMSSRRLATCQSEHQSCQRQSTQHLGFLPTRLLDVGPIGQPEIRLVSCETLEMTGSTVYLTLSYCWGKGNSAACTTESNIRDRLKGILVSSLPQTVQDAIVLTRAFRVRYLWIDALCILQGGSSDEDWRRELPNMGKIYRDSLFTIAASSAADSSTGFLRRKTGTQWPAQNYVLSRTDDPCTENDDDILLRPRYLGFSEAVDWSALSKRGWVLQERILSSRTLFWTEFGVFWECNQLRRSEYERGCSPYNDIGLAALVNSLRSHEFLTKLRGNGEPSVCKEARWTEVVQVFSNMSLTHVADKLPAITGLGQELARLTGSEFEMGVFKHNLVQELAWVTGFKNEDTAEQQKQRIKDTPSWCWASAHRHLLFRPQLRFEQQAQELAMNVQLSEQRIHARGRIARLQIRALDDQTISLTRFYDGSTISVASHTFRPRRCCVDAPVKYGSYVYDEFAIFDTLSEAPPEEGGSITCIEWLRWGAGQHGFEPKDVQRLTVTGAIIIAPTGEGSNIYRRVGWLEVFDASFFDKEPQDIVLV